MAANSKLKHAMRKITKNSQGVGDPSQDDAPYTPTRAYIRYSYLFGIRGLRRDSEAM